MSSYVITGASRGLGFEFVRQLSSVPGNTVFALSRNKETAEKKVATELPGRQNVHIIEADAGSNEDLKKAADSVAAVTGGSLDYVIANAAFIDPADGTMPISAMSDDAKRITQVMHNSIDVNVLGAIFLYNAFMPLILKGKAKKVIDISSGMADVEFVRNFDIAVGAVYATSKAALNVIAAKYSAEYRSQGVLFLSLSPGLVDTGKVDPSKLTPEQIAGFQAMVDQFQGYAPDFKGPISEEESVKKVMHVIDNASVEKGDGGAFISHLGNKQWL